MTTDNRETNGSRIPITISKAFEHCRLFVSIVTLDIFQGEFDSMSPYSTRIDGIRRGYTPVPCTVLHEKFQFWRRDRFLLSAEQMPPLVPHEKFQSWGVILSKLLPEVHP